MADPEPCVEDSGGTLRSLFFAKCGPPINDRTVVAWTVLLSLPTMTLLRYHGLIRRPGHFALAFAGMGAFIYFVHGGDPALQEPDGVM